MWRVEGRAVRDKSTQKINCQQQLRSRRLKFRRHDPRPTPGGAGIEDTGLVWGLPPAGAPGENFRGLGVAEGVGARQDAEIKSSNTRVEASIRL